MFPSLSYLRVSLIINAQLFSSIMNGGEAGGSGVELIQALERGRISDRFRSQTCVITTVSQPKPQTHVKSILRAVTRGIYREIHNRQLR
jgi:hypothetical protein